MILVPTKVNITRPLKGFKKLKWSKLAFFLCILVNSKGFSLIIIKIEEDMQNKPHTKKHKIP